MCALFTLTGKKQLCDEKEYAEADSSLFNAVNKQFW